MEAMNDGTMERDNKYFIFSTDKHKMPLFSDMKILLSGKTFNIIKSLPEAQ